MKSVLCYGDSNTWGCIPMIDRDHGGRFGPHERWPGVVRDSLGEGWWVIEEGLPGRTTVLDDPFEGIHKNGRTYLLPCLESHRPLDAVAIMLGTNDLKARFALTPDDIAEGVGALLEIVKASFLPGDKPPAMLVICPPPAKSSGWLGPLFAGADERARKMAPLYRAVAQRYGAAFFDAGTVAACCDEDGVHLDLAAHRAIGTAAAAEIRRLLP